MTKAMRLRPPFSIVAMAWLACSVAPVAHAQLTYGYDLSWNDCIGLPGAAANIDYACDGSRDGNPFKLVISFVSPYDLPKFAGAQANLNFRTQSLILLPDWWRFGVDECREGSIDFPGGRTGIGTGTTGACVDPWSPDSSGGGFRWSTHGDGGGAPGFGFLRLGFAQFPSGPIQAGQRYFLPPILIDPADPESCDGCDLPGCIAVTVVELYQDIGTPPQDNVIMEYRPINRLFVTWQGGQIGGFGCPAEVPTKRATWGAIKAIYR